MTRRRNLRDATIHGERGLALVELLVALVVVGVGLVGLAAVVPVSSRGIAQGHQLSTAAFLAEQRLEQVRAAPWTESPARDCLGTSGDAPSSWAPTATGIAPLPDASCGAPGLADEGPAPWPNNPLPAPYRSYTRLVRIRPCDVPGSGCGVSAPALRLVTVRVLVTPAHGMIGAPAAPQLVELTSLVARR
jgi:type II secretory pathway pseudopilin PulG